MASFFGYRFPAKKGRRYAAAAEHGGRPGTPLADHRKERFALYRLAYTQHQAFPKKPAGRFFPFERTPGPLHRPRKPGTALGSKLPGPGPYRQNDRRMQTVFVERRPSGQYHL